MNVNSTKHFFLQPVLIDSLCKLNKKVSCILVVILKGLDWVNNCLSAVIHVIFIFYFS